MDPAAIYAIAMGVPIVITLIVFCIAAGIDIENKRQAREQEEENAYIRGLEHLVLIPQERIAHIDDMRYGQRHLPRSDLMMDVPYLVRESTRYIADARHEWQQAMMYYRRYLTQYQQMGPRERAILRTTFHARILRTASIAIRGFQQGMTMYDEWAISNHSRQVPVLWEEELASWNRQLNVMRESFARDDTNPRPTSSSGSSSDDPPTSIVPVPVPATLRSESDEVDTNTSPTSSIESSSDDPPIPIVPIPAPVPAPAPAALRSESVIVEECCICMNPYDRVVRKRHYLPCAHTFCKWCLDNWMKECRELSCPLCRAVFSRDAIGS